MKESDFKTGLSPVWEDYLKLVLELNETQGEARVTDIANRLNVTKATVSQTVKKLIIFGLAQKGNNRLIVLTDSGKKQALKIKTRNIVINRFLTEILGVDRKISERDACKIEHLLSCETIEKIEGFCSDSQNSDVI